MRILGFAVFSCLLALTGCANPAPDDAAQWQPPRYTGYSSSAAAAGWGARFPAGFGYANPEMDPGPASAGSRR